MLKLKIKLSERVGHHWDNCNMYEKSKLQFEAARKGTGITRSSTLHSLYRETGWLTLADR